MVSLKIRFYGCRGVVFHLRAEGSEGCLEIGNFPHRELCVCSRLPRNSPTFMHFPLSSASSNFLGTRGNFLEIRFYDFNRSSWRCYNENISILSPKKVILGFLNHIFVNFHFLKSTEIFEN